jgi:excisionase family DNA binding protein
MPQSTQLVSAEQVAAWWGVSTETVRAWARDGRIPSVRTPGGHFRFDPDLVRPAAEDGSPSMRDAEHVA